MKSPKSCNLSHSNIDEATVSGFGDEWARFSQEVLPKKTKDEIFQDYLVYFHGICYHQIRSALM
jgi:hypothetical protein